MKREIYLEISSRQSGKTERLLKELNNHSMFRGDCVVVANNIQQLNNLKRSIHDMNEGYINRIVFKTYSQLLTFFKDTRGIEFQNLRFFYDEFDFFDDEFYLDPKGYYVTTPRKLRTSKYIVLHHYGFRDDMMLDLLKLTKGRYEAYTSYPNMNLDIMINLSNSLRDEEFSKEFGQTLFKNI